MHSFISSIFKFFQWGNKDFSVRTWVMQSKKQHKEGVYLIFSLLIYVAVKFCDIPPRKIRQHMDTALLNEQKRYANNYTCFECACYLMGRLSVFLNIQVKSRLYDIFEMQFVELFAKALEKEEVQIKNILEKRVKKYVDQMSDDKKIKVLHDRFARLLYRSWDKVLCLEEDEPLLNKMSIIEETSIIINIQEWEIHSIKTFLDSVLSISSKVTAKYV